ncbi:MAG: hypothetical protein OXU38_05155, partial [Gemmatimonadota bacterium]|nr:hypothetical protein [Gemmatimonadota bacterium]
TVTSGPYSRFRTPNTETVLAGSGSNVGHRAPASNLVSPPVSRAQARVPHAPLSFGFRYRFGSISNNVVNTRFGGIGNRDRF